MVGMRRNSLLHRLFLMLLLLPAAGGTAVGQQRFELQREAMVQKSLEAEGIRNPRVLEAMRKVPRHEFVRTADRSRSYEDTALPIGNQQTISPPYVVAYMTEVLDPGPEDRVLEIGTGSGYQAAVLGAICRDVYTIEIVPQLAKQATRRLQDLGYENVHVREGDGYKGWEEHAPFDRIIVTCSPESIPQPLIDQLREGGRMIIPMGERYQQSFHLLKKENGELQDEKLISTLFVPMTGESEEQRRVQPDPDQPQIVNGGFERDENGDGRVDGWHYQRNARLEAEGAMEGQQYLRFENADPDSLSQALQGTAVNGRRLAGLRLQFWMRCTAVVPGAGPSGQAAVVVHFYDGVRREIGAVVIGRWRGTLDWQDVRTVVQVPAEAKEMIFRIGLNGAVGQLDLDDLKIVPIPR
ncbi:MAG: protein-L-isoaspartate(D-aspartate) O-methyltransferase [Planctomycetaceae bacterium]